MKTSRLIVLMGSTCLLLAGAAAQAQGHGGRHHGGDRAGGHDGPGGGAHRAMMMLRAADANGDNSITRAEVEALQAEMFTWMDRNGDGFLDMADQSPVRQRLRAIHQAEMAERGDDAPRWRRRGSGRSGPGEDGPGRRFDDDEDGRISRAEFLDRENRLFAALDANEDGVIEPDELDAAAERRQDRRFWWRD